VKNSSQKQRRHNPYLKWCDLWVFAKSTIAVSLRSCVLTVLVPLARKVLAGTERTSIRTKNSDGELQHRAWEVTKVGSK